MENIDLYKKCSAALDKINVEKFDETKDDSTNDISAINDYDDSNDFLIGFKPVNNEVVNSIKPAGFEYNFDDDHNDEERICQVVIQTDRRTIRYDIYGDDKYVPDKKMSVHEMYELIKKLKDSGVIFINVFNEFVNLDI